jgi:hypothetical protein
MPNIAFTSCGAGQKGDMVERIPMEEKPYEICIRLSRQGRGLLLFLAPAKTHDVLRKKSNLPFSLLLCPDW